MALALAQPPDENASILGGIGVVPDAKERARCAPGIFRSTADRTENLPVEGVTDGSLDGAPEPPGPSRADIPCFERESRRSVREPVQIVAAPFEPNPAGDCEFLVDDFECTMTRRQDARHPLEKMSVLVDASGLFVGARECLLGAHRHRKEQTQRQRRPVPDLLVEEERVPHPLGGRGAIRPRDDGNQRPRSDRRREPAVLSERPRRFHFDGSPEHRAILEGEVRFRRARRLGEAPQDHEWRPAPRPARRRQSAAPDSRRELRRARSKARTRRSSPAVPARDTRRRRSGRTRIRPASGGAGAREISPSSSARA